MVSNLSSSKNVSAESRLAYLRWIYSTIAREAPFYGNLNVSSAEIEDPALHEAHDLAGVYFTRRVFQDENIRIQY